MKNGSVYSPQGTLIGSAVSLNTVSVGDYAVSCGRWLRGVEPDLCISRTPPVTPAEGFALRLLHRERYRSTEVESVADAVLARDRVSLDPIDPDRSHGTNV